MKRFIILMLITAMVLTLVACGGSDIVGKWEAKDDMGLGISIVMEFTESKMIMMGIEMDYEVKGDAIIISFEGQEQEGTYSVDGDVLSITFIDPESGEGSTQEFNRVEE